MAIFQDSFDEIEVIFKELSPNLDSNCSETFCDMSDIYIIAHLWGKGNNLCSAILNAESKKKIKRKIMQSCFV